MKKLYRIFSLLLICAVGCVEAATNNQDFTDGLKLLEQHQYEKAIESFNLVLKVIPGSPFVWERIGYAHFCLENYYQAINDYTIAITLLPSNPLFLMQRALAYHATGNINAMKHDLIAAAKMGSPVAREFLKKHDIAW